MQKTILPPRFADVVDLEVHFPVKISLFVAIVILALSAIFYWDSLSIRESLIFFAGSIAAGGAVLAAIYTARTLNLQLEAAIANGEMERRRYSLQFASRWNDSSMLETRKACREIVNMKFRGLDDLYVALGTGISQDSVIHLLNFFEELSIAIDEGVADPRVLNDLFAEVCFQVWTTLEGWIANYRNIRCAKNLWGGLEKLNAQWKKTRD